ARRPASASPPSPPASRTPPPSRAPTRRCTTPSAAAATAPPPPHEPRGSILVRGTPARTAVALSLLRKLLAIAAAAISAWAWPAGAASLRIASAFDPQTMDPHSLVLLYNTRVVFSIYEGLVGHDPQYRLAPALATGWQQLDPLTWRFRLRPGVRF